ncbi:MAG: hypothetical protein WDZ88_01330 [Candidatus Paceibacterota bacterium]
MHTETILQTEQAVAKKIEDTRIQAGSIVAKAKIDAETRLSDKKAELLKKRSERIEEQKQIYKQEYRKILLDAETQKEKIIAKAEKEKGSATALILKELL